MKLKLTAGIVVIASIVLGSLVSASADDFKPNQAKLKPLNAPPAQNAILPCAAFATAFVHLASRSRRR